MIDEDYLISIIGRQTVDGETGEVKLNTVGSYRKQGNARLIAYKEYDEDDPKRSRTAILKIEDNSKVTMMKAGTPTRLILEKGKRHTCIYGTEFGALSIGVYTSELKSELSDAGGKLSVNYTLDIESSLSSSNEILVEVRPGNILSGKENL